MADDPYPALTDAVPSESRAREMAVADAKQAARWLEKEWSDSDPARAEWPLTGEYVDTWINRRLRTMAKWSEPLKTLYMDAVKSQLDAEGITWCLQGYQLHLIAHRPPQASD